MAGSQEANFVLAFPTRLLEQATGAVERRRRLQLFCDEGLKCKSVCSGIDAPGEALRLLQIAQRVASSQQPWAVHSSWCDKGAVQQKFLYQRALEIEKDSRPCLFTSVEAVVPPEVRKKLRCDAPLPVGSKAEQAAAKAFYAELGFRLEELGQQAFPSGHTAPCLVHQQACPVRQSQSMPPGMKQEKPLRMCAGGLPCIAYSKVGLQRQSSDPSEIAFQVWVSERKHLALKQEEDMFLFENVVCYPVEKISSRLAETHYIIALPFDPQDRARLRCAGFVNCEW